jgi:hypothetical protein
MMLLRGDGEADARARLPHYVQAIAAAPEGSETKRVAREKRALLLLALADGDALSGAARHDIREAAAELEAIGSNEKAAAAYATAGDVDGQARALAAAGSVEDLEDLLAGDAVRRKTSRVRSDALAEIDDRITSGRRREGLALAEARIREAPDDLVLRERVASLRARRVAGSVVHVHLNGQLRVLALGSEIILGRTEGLVVASHAVSRRHVRISRDQAGIVTVEDLGSRNGTQLHGMNIVGKHAVGEGIELRIGKEVPLRITPAREVSGAFEIDVAGDLYIAPLGSAKLLAGWTLESAADGWLELVAANPAYVGDVELSERSTLLVGDALSTERRAPAVLEILGGQPV